MVLPASKYAKLNTESRAETRGMYSVLRSLFITIIGNIPFLTDEDIRKSKIESYLTEVLKIKDVLPITIPKDLPTTMNRLTYQGANAIEKMLYEVYNLIELMTSFYYYSGEIYAGSDLEYPAGPVSPFGP